MEDREFSPELRDFLSQRINSVLQLELLLLLRASAPRAWTAEEIARELRIEEASATAQAEDVCAGGLLQVHRQEQGRYSYQSTDPALHQVIEELSLAYLNRRVSIISLIYSKPLDRVKAFADAFRLRKDESHG